MAQRSVAKRRNGKGDLNRAARDELMEVPGIGPATADAILRHRKERGAFESLDQLDEIAALGSEAAANLRARFAVPDKAVSPAPGAEGAAKAASGAARNTGEALAATAEKPLAATADSGHRIAGREIGEPGADVAAEAGRTSVEQAKAENAAPAGAVRSAQEAAARAPEKMGRGAGEAAETLAASTGGVLEGMQEWQRTWLACAQAQLEDTLAAGRDLARCRTPQDLVEVQVRYARASMQRVVGESAKLAELGARIAGAGVRPLQAAALQGRSKGSGRAGG